MKKARVPSRLYPRNTSFRLESSALFAAHATTKRDPRFLLLADVELGDECAVTLDADALQVVELATTLADELEQTTT